MTPERAGELVQRWVRFYTRGMSPRITQRRIEEVGADIRDEILLGRAAGVSDARIARSIVSRMVRGLAADAAWRRQVITANSRVGIGSKGSRPVFRSVVRVAVGVCLILAIPLVATLTSQEADWRIGDFVVAAALLSAVGVVLELAVRRAGNGAVVIGAAALGLAAGCFGQVDDAPGLILLGIMLLAGAAVLALRRVPRRG